MFHKCMDTIAESWAFCDQIAQYYNKGHSTYIVKNETTTLKLWPLGAIEPVVFSGTIQDITMALKKHRMAPYSM